MNKHNSKLSLNNAMTVLDRKSTIDHKKAGKLPKTNQKEVIKRDKMIQLWNCFKNNLKRLNRFKYAKITS